MNAEGESCCCLEGVLEGGYCCLEGDILGDIDDWAVDKGRFESWSAFYRIMVILNDALEMNIKKAHGQK